MTREFAAEILKFATLALFLFASASHFFFKRKGFVRLVTRKTLWVTYVSWLFFIMSASLFAWFSNPPSLESAILMSIICCVSVVILSVLSAVEYFRFPYIEDMTNEVEEDIDKIKKTWTRSRRDINKK